MAPNDEPSDEMIATAVQNGDADAFGFLITRFEAKLKRYARRFLSANHEIEDLVQDVFIKAYTNIQSFDPKRRFSPWIYRIAHNTFVNELRRKERGLTFFDADLLLPHLAAKETADEAALEAEFVTEVEALVGELSPKYREVIVLHYFENLSYQEISDVMHIPLTTVGVRMTRARSKLKEIYQHNQHTP
jgi:RNA polymerase sigma-70 factor (ECF subfamily)